jgi:hypothetical protein
MCGRNMAILTLVMWLYSEITGDCLNTLFKEVGIESLKKNTIVVFAEMAKIVLNRSRIQRGKNHSY